MGQLDWTAVCLDRLSREPLGDQLAAAIEARVATGLLEKGARLPTTRELAGVLGINRGAVQSAYSKLARQGLLASRVGSGTIVRGPAPAPLDFDPTALLSRRALQVAFEVTPPLPISLTADFSKLTPDERFFPIEDFTRTLTETWARRKDLWQYAPPLGLLELREEIARRLADHGVSRSADEIVVTSGAQQGLDLLFRTFTDPGDVVATESPTYSGALALARFSGVEILPLPVGPEGPDTSPLLGRRAKLVYVMPERQNPTGLTTTEERREDLLEGTRSAGALGIEDGYRYPESGLPPVAARGPSGRRGAGAAAASGVGIAPGGAFEPRGDDPRNLRLSVSRVDKRQVDTGIRLLAEAVQAVISQSGIRAVPVV